MGNVSSICCQQTKSLDHAEQLVQKKWQFQFTQNPQITNEKVSNRLRQLELQTLIISEHPGAKEQPPMKQTNKDYIYVGSWLNDIPDGYGKIYFKNGDFFEGEFFEGVANGIGRYIFENGTYFQGQIKQNQAVGEGKYISEQFEFCGEFIDSKPSKGKYLLSNNTEIILQSPTNGIIRWPNGNKYVGQIRNFNPEGDGILQFANGSVYQGTFSQGQIEGKGNFTWTNGTKYMGHFHNGLKHGKGQLHYRNGTTFIGDWKNGKQQGLGKIMKEQKQIFSSYFIQGVPTSEAQYEIHVKSQLQQKQVARSNIYNNQESHQKSQQLPSNKKQQSKLLVEHKQQQKLQQNKNEQKLQQNKNEQKLQQYKHEQKLQEHKHEQRVQEHKHEQIAQKNQSTLKKQSNIKQQSHPPHNDEFISEQKSKNIAHNQLSA